MKPNSNLWKSIIIIAAFALSYAIAKAPLINDGEYVHSVIGAFTDLIFPDNRIMYKLLKELLSLVVPAIAIGIVAGWRKIFEAWGVARDILFGCGMGLLFCVPMFVCHLIFGHFEFSWDSLLLKAVFPGFFEEMFYRGFLFGMLYRYCKWNFFCAALVAAVIFMYGHAYQSNDIISLLLVFAVTAFGSILFSWLYKEWQFNLWVPIALHVGMDFVWSLMPIDGVENSVGNIAANVGRALTIIAAIVITIIYTKRQSSKA
ncbi:MAG: CPBP family intramembrane metalloprotease [Marinilabiliaceae bacterium]|nr:CPBP family intramembrane metalloprotease [Marinilabiliaceae bacterium]